MYDIYNSLDNGYFCLKVVSQNQWIHKEIHINDKSKFRKDETVKQLFKILQLHFTQGEICRIMA